MNLYQLTAQKGSQSAGKLKGLYVQSVCIHVQYVCVRFGEYKHSVKRISVFTTTFLPPSLHTAQKQIFVFTVLVARIQLTVKSTLNPVH